VGQPKGAIAILQIVFSKRGPKMTNVAPAEYRHYACMYCGHIHDEEAGSPENGIAPGTRWEDIPDNWSCPMCSAEKPDFELVD
jgi:rubredoxin